MVYPAFEKYHGGQGSREVKLKMAPDQYQLIRSH